MNYSFDIEDAQKYGVNEAIMLNNFKFWLRKNHADQINIHDGRVWTYNTQKAYKELFPFWTEPQIRYILKSLIKQGVLMTGNYNKVGYDRTLWYAFIDPNVLELNIRSNDHMETIKSSDGNDQMIEPIPDRKTQLKNAVKKETTKENLEEFNADHEDALAMDVTFDNKKERLRKNAINAKAIIDHLNKKTGFSYKYATSHINHINARLEEGHILQDFIHVIDAKVEEWEGTKMEQYLRPATLFNNEKFNQYVGQLAKSKVDDFSWADGSRVSDHTNVIEGEFSNGR